MQTTEFILSPQGSLKRRRILEEDIAVTDEQIMAMAAGFSRPWPNAFQIPDWGAASLMIGEKRAYVTVRLRRIPLKAPFTMLDGKLVPDFASTTDPVMRLSWTPSEGMRIYLLISASLTGEGFHHVEEVWLFAQDTRQRLYKLPLPNLHDDCRLCLGEQQRRFETLAEAAVGVIAQFENSPWNADLWSNLEITQKMFSFTPKNDGFDVNAPEFAPWMEGCTKVSVEAAKYLYAV